MLAWLEHRRATKAAALPPSAWGANWLDFELARQEEQRRGEVSDDIVSAEEAESDEDTEPAGEAESDEDTESDEDGESAED